jgi:hypothetical protein
VLDERRKASKDDSPAVYRFVSPDGRSYVGSTRRIKLSALKGLQRSGWRIAEAEAKFPPETWRLKFLSVCRPDA